MNLDPTQQRAVELSLASRFHMVNGGAGVGKTTIIREIADQLTALRRPVALCAFAGKAAARLREATGHDATTIHRLLEYNGVAYRLASLEDVDVIVDEASMIDIHLMAEIIKRKPNRLILVGDQAQLPPVGKGQPFHDMINVFPHKVTTLTNCYRNSEAVFHVALQIRAGQFPPDALTSDNETWKLIQTGSPEKTHESILKAVRSGHIDFEKDIILVARNGDMPCCVGSLNRDIVDIVNPRKSDEQFRVGDRVINIKNFADADVWNGTTGTIASIDSAGCPWVDLDDPIGNGDTRVLWTKEMKKSLQLAYALTVHKSQGSQYRRVLIACVARDAQVMLDRSLIYTAVTRTKNACAVMGDKRAFYQSIQTERNKTTVMQMLASKIGE